MPDPRVGNALLASSEDYLASRFSESMLVTALAAKYGIDPAMNARSLPPPAAAAVVELDGIEEEMAAVQTADVVTRQRGRAVGPAPGASDAAAAAAADAADATAAVPPGGALVTQLVLQHLRSRHDLELAATLFAAELRGRGLGPEFFVAASAPEAVHGLGARASALAALLHPQDLVRAHVRRLLADGGAKLTETIAGGRHGAAVRQLLVQMFEEGMWAATHRPEQRLREYYRPDSHVLRAASLNHVVERVTTVVFRPHVSVPSARSASDSGLMRALFRVHRHFCPSHVLLAKLLQRFFVPSHLALEHSYDMHEIIIDAPMDVTATLAPALPPGAGLSHAAVAQREEAVATRARYHAIVSRELQLKVCSVLLQWLDAHPAHFDLAMLDALDAFVRECLFAPASWAAAAGERQQFGESLRGLMARRVRALQGRPEPAVSEAPEVARPRPANGAVSNPGLLKGAVHRDPFADDLGDDPMDFLFSRRGTAAPRAAAAPRADSGFLAIDGLALAAQLTVLDHALLCDIDPDELQTFAIVTALAAVPAAAHPAPNVRRFLRRGELTVLWLVTEVLTAGAAAAAAAGDDDGGGGGGGSRGGGGGGGGGAPPRASLPARLALERAAVVARVVALAFRLLELNNLHGAFCAFAALRHPCVARLALTWRAVAPEALHGLAELSRFFAFENGPAAYKEYVASISDDEVYPLVPVLQVTIDELRRLDATEPAVLRDSQGTGVLHWRKFAVLARILGDFAALRGAALPGDLVPAKGCAQWIGAALQAAAVDPDDLTELSALAEPVDP